MNQDVSDPGSGPAYSTNEEILEVIKFPSELIAKKFLKNPFPLLADRSLSFAQLFVFLSSRPPLAPQACFLRAPAWTAKPGSWSSPAPKFCTSRCPSSTSTRSTPRPGRTPSSTSAPFTGSRPGEGMAKNTCHQLSIIYKFPA